MAIDLGKGRRIGQPLFGAALAGVIAYAAPGIGWGQDQSRAPTPASTGSTDDKPEATTATGTTELESIEVVSSPDVDERLSSTTAKLVVGRKEIEQFGDGDLADLLKRLPGLSIDSSSGRGQTVRMRGLSRGYAQILINGEPAPNGFSLDSIAPELIERIEILRTPTADLSTQGIAGSINIVLKRAGPKLQREFKLTAGNEHGQPSASLSGQVGKGGDVSSYLLAATVGREDFLRTSGFAERGFDANGDETLARTTERESDNRSTSTNLLGNAKRALSNDGSLGIEGLYGERRVDGWSRDRSVTFYGSPPDYASNDVDYRNDTRQFQGKLKWQYRPSQYARLDTEFGYKFNRRDSDVIFIGYDNDGTLVLERDVNSRTSDHVFNLNGKYAVPVGERHTLSLGLQGEHSQREDRRLQDDRAFAGQTEFDIDEAYRANVGRLAFYAQDEWAPRERVSVYFGFRWETIKTRTEGNMIAKARHRAELISPIVQVLWGIPGVKTDQVRFSFSRTHKLPEVAELVPRRFISNNNTPTSPDTEGNPDLRPERAWGLDVGYERVLKGNGLLSASLYGRRIDDVILQSLGESGGLWISRPINNGRADVFGVSLEAKFQLNTLLRRGPAVDVKMSLDRNWSSVDTVPGPRNTLDRQQPLSFNLGFDHRLSSVPVNVGGNFNFAGSRMARISQTQMASLGVRRVLDLYAVWKPGDRTSIRLTLTNLLRQDTEAVSIYADDNGSLQQTTLTPTRASLRLVLSYSF